MFVLAVIWFSMELGTITESSTIFPKFYYILYVQVYFALFSSLSFAKAVDTVNDVNSY